jgi:hypothetical protein
MAKAKKRTEKHYAFPNPDDLSKADMSVILREIQGILWAKPDGTPDPDLEWGGGTIEQVADAMSRLQAELE